MTCIAGIEHGGRVTIAGDSAIGWDTTQVLDSVPKVRRWGDIIYGAAGSARADNLLMLFEPPDPGDEGLDIFAIHIACALRKHLAELGCEEPELNILMGIGPRLVSLDSELGVHFFRSGYGSIGSGGDIALGALAATGSAGYMPRERLRVAMVASAAHCPTVAPPFVYESTA